MDQFAIRDPRNGKYCRKGSRETKGKDEEPHALFTKASQAKTSISQKKTYLSRRGEGDLQYEIVPVNASVDEDGEIISYG